MSITHSNDKQMQETLLSLAPSAQSMPTSATLAINEAVAQRRATGRETLHLGFGEASFPLHPSLKNALSEAARSTGYAPVQGLPALRQAIAAYLTRERGLSCSQEQVIVAPGSKPLLYGLLQVLDGDVLLPVPSWVSYGPQARLAGRRVIDVQTEPTDHHRLTPAALTRAVEQARSDGARPRILIVNTPSNPTGSMFERADVEALAHWARANGIVLISDEIYAELAHGWREHVSPAHYYPEGCIITGGLSKAFAAGGWRLGYAILPATSAGTQVMNAVRGLASEIWSSASTPVQQAALVAFSADASIKRYVQNSTLLYRYVTNQLYETLTQLGVLCARPAGAFYLYPDFAPWRDALKKIGVETSLDLAHYLLDTWDIATLPASVFGEHPSALRLRLATSMLCLPDAYTTIAQSEATLWQLLAHAETLVADKESEQLSLPLLARVQTRWLEVIQALR